MLALLHSAVPKFERFGGRVAGSESVLNCL